MKCYQLTERERDDFASAASALLAAKEPAALLRDRPGVPGAGAVRARVVAAGRAVGELFAGLKRDHPGLVGVRFRGHVFVLEPGGGAARVLRESDLADVDG